MEHLITSRDAAAMASHWLGCPVNGYLGSGYGSDLKALLHTPMGAGLADGVVEKCRADIPLLGQADSPDVNVYWQDAGMDRKAIVFEVAGQFVETDGNQSGARHSDPAEGEKKGLDALSESASERLHTLVNVTLPAGSYL